MTRPTFELFEISPAYDQDPDAGWYFWLKVGRKDVGDPSGPFPTPEAAGKAAKEEFID